MTYVTPPPTLAEVAMMPRFAMSTVGEHRLEHRQPPRVGQLAQVNLVPFRNGVGPIGADHDALHVARHQQRRVLQRAGILQELAMGSIEVLVLALVLPREPAAAPHVSPSLAAAGLGGALLKSVGRPGRVRIGRRLAQQGAQIQEVFLRRGALVASVGLPLGDKRGRNHRATLREKPGTAKGAPGLHEPLFLRPHGLMLL